MFEIHNKTPNICGCRGERVNLRFEIVAPETIDRLEIMPENRNATIRAVKKWWQHGRSIGAQGSYLNKELLLADPNLIKTDESNSYLRSGDEYVRISGPDAELPSDVKIFDSNRLQSMRLQAGEIQEFWVTLTIPETDCGTLPVCLGISADGKTRSIQFSIEILPFDLKKSDLMIGCYYTQCLTDYPNPPLTSRHFVSEQRMLAELRLMRGIGIEYPSWYAEGTKWIDAAMSLRTKAGFPADKMFWTTIRTDTGSEAELRQRCQNMRKMFPDSDVYLYGKEEVADQISQIPRWDITRGEGCKVWNAMSPTNAGLVVGHIDLVNVSHTGGQTSPIPSAADHIAAGGRVACYSCPHLGQDVEFWAVRRNYGWSAWSLGYNAIFPYVLRDHSDAQHAWLDWSGDTTYRPIVAAYPTTDGVIGTCQLEALGDAIIDLRYLATLQAAIKTPKPSRSFILSEAIAWLDQQKNQISNINNNERLNDLRSGLVHYILALSC